MSDVAHHHPQTPSSKEEGASAALHQANLFAPAKQIQFLEALALWGNARSACRMACVSHQTVYRHRRNSADFRLAWDAALVVARPQVEEVLGDRALNGIEEVIYYHGDEIGRRRRYDSRLLLAHLGRLDRVGDREDVAEVAGDFDAALERLRRGEPVDPLCAEDEGADEGWAERDDDRPAWMDESLPFVERVLLYLEDIEDDAGGEADGSGGGPDPFAPTAAADDDDDDEYEAEEDFDPSRYVLRDNPSLDSVTPVTLQQDEEPEDGPGGPSAALVEPASPEAGSPEAGTSEADAPEARAVPEPAPEPKPRIWGPWRPIHDGRMQRIN